MSAPQLKLLDLNGPPRSTPAPSGSVVSFNEQELAMKMVCLLVANGETTKATAQKCGCDESWVRKVISSPAGMDMIVRFQHDSNPSLAGRLGKMAGIALDVQLKLLLSETSTDAVKAKVAQEVIDRAHGKAIQITENRNVSFDLKDAVALDQALLASQEKLRRIEEMQKKLAISV